MYSPLAASMPRLRAAQMPAFFWVMTWMQGYSLASVWQSRSVPSVEPSLTMMISSSGTCWERMDSTAVRRVVSALYAGTTTLILAMGVPPFTLFFQFQI